MELIIGITATLCKSSYLEGGLGRLNVYNTVMVQLKGDVDLRRGTNYDLQPSHKGVVRSRLTLGAPKPSLAGSDITSATPVMLYTPTCRD